MEGLKTKVEAMEQEIQKKDQLIQQMSESLVQNEQYSRRRQMEISEASESRGQKLKNVVVDIGGKLGLTIPPKDIEVVHRILVKKKLEPVIVEFSSGKIRDEFLLKRRNTATTNESLLGPGFSKNQIFVNESLSPYFKTRLWKAKAKCRELNYKYCWFKQSKVFAKQNDNSSSVVIIKCENDIEKIQ